MIRLSENLGIPPTCVWNWVKWWKMRINHDFWGVPGVLWLTYLKRYALDTRHRDFTLGVQAPHHRHSKVWECLISTRFVIMICSTLPGTEAMGLMGGGSIELCARFSTKWRFMAEKSIYNWLVVWNMNFMTFHSVGNVIIPTDELVFFRGVGLNHQPDKCGI